MKLTLLSLTALSTVTASGPFQSQRAFGIAPHATSTASSCIESVFSLRGGAVHESSTLDDLESRIQSAALNDKLTVIDFTAT
jgi:hypothetical protein